MLSKAKTFVTPKKIRRQEKRDLREKRVNLQEQYTERK